MRNRPHSSTSTARWALAGLLLAPATLFGTDYHVGPGQSLAAIADVPWATLGPGDRVFIHWRSDPYREKWVLNRRGSAAQPILVSGVAGPGGELPVIDGRDATTPAPLNFWNEERGVIKIGGSNTPADGLPAYITIENLEIRSGRPPFEFTGDDGTTRTYAQNAASIYIEKAEHLTIRNCVIHDSGNGIFAGAFDGQTQDLLIEGNYIHGNGNIGSAFHHNTYMAAIGVVYQYNRFGPLRAGADGNNLKDRSAGLVVRYNWIEGGNRQLDLVDAEDSEVVVQHRSYDETFAYGNVLIEPDGAGNSQIVHYGGDSGTTADYRKGTLYFFHNTVVSTRSGNTTLLRMSTNDESADVRNNILYVTASGSKLAMLNAAGALTLRNNWTKTGWQASHSGLTGSIDDNGSGITGTTPGFAGEAAQDYALTSGSQARDAGTVLHSGAAAHPVTRHYERHQSSTARPDDGDPDLGAFEFCPDAACGLPPAAPSGLELGDG